VAGDAITGQTSGATATVVGTTELLTGTWLLSTAAGNMGLVSISGGPFQDGERLLTATVEVATADDTIQGSSIADTYRKSYLRGARDHTRSFITAPTGAGGILGGFVLNGDVYAWRNDVTPTYAVLHKATASGWSAVTLTGYIRYTTGTAEIAEGDTITGASSGHTATVRRVNIAAGNYAGPTYASGRLAITGSSGTFTNGENLQVGGVTKAVANGTRVTASTQLKDGEYQHVVTNFYGASNLQRVYGCDGINRAFEFDGTYFMSIETGMTTDTPNVIEAHRNHLFLAFPGGSLQNSATGTPDIWSARLGASEIGLGGDVSNMKSNGNDALAITTTTSVQVLRGTSDLDWSLKQVSDSIGSTPFTMQEGGGQTLFLDRSGVNTIQAVAGTTDLGTDAISRNVRKTLDRSFSGAIDSISSTKKNHYRIFFDDKSALVATFFGNKLMGWMPMLYTHQFTRTWSGPDANDVVRLYAGTSTGYVMEMDIGTSFDGDNIVSIVQLPFNYQKSPDRDKRFHKITLEVDTPQAIDLRVATDFDYGSGGQSNRFSITSLPTGGVWDTSSWENFFWDSATLSSPEINIDGIGRNIGITIFHNDDVDDAFTLSAMLLQFSVYGIRR
jgi:hypothetical protein